MLPRGFCLKIVAAHSPECEICNKRTEYVPISIDPYITCCESCMQGFAPMLLGICQELQLKKNQSKDMN